MRHAPPSWRAILIAGFALAALIATGLAAAQTDSPPRVFGFTSQRADGNRLMAGVGSLPGAVTLDIALDGRPAWVVGAPLDDSASIWVAVLEDGRAQAFRVEGTTASAFPITPDHLPPGMPPLLVIENGAASLLIPPANDASRLTHPVIVDDAGTLAYIAQNGDVVFWREEAEIARVTANALPDARLLLDGEGWMLVYAAPSEDYDHGVLGDRIEPSGYSLIDITSLSERRASRIGGGSSRRVFEGLMPIWADLTGDGLREIITTISDVDQGARIHVYTEAGGDLAESDAIGTGYRWRHQIAVAPFGPNGELELVDVRTPHIGGIVEFLRVDRDTLPVVASRGGFSSSDSFSSHPIGSRNLDMAAAGDFDGDGRVELLVPSQAMTDFGGLRHANGDSIEVAWTVSIGGQLSTNVAGVTLPNGRLIVGAGRADGALRLWLP